MSISHSSSVQIAGSRILSFGVIGITAMVILFSAIYLPVSGLVGKKEALRETEARLNARIDFEYNALAQQYQSLERSVRFLARTPPIQGIVRAAANDGLDPLENSSQEVWEERLQRIFAAFIKENPAMRQIRYIGVADGGRELVRVDARNGQVKIIGKSGLQRKGSREYFRKAIAVNDGEVYFSEINLNREYGRIETPHTPMLRAAMPIYAKAGKQFGILIINQEMGAALSRLNQTEDGNQSLYLLNKRNEYLVHPDPSKTFSGDLDGEWRWEKEFSPLPPEYEFAELEHLESFRGPDGTIYAVQRPFRQGQVSGDYTLIAAVPVQTITERLDARRGRSLLLLGVIAVLGALLVLGLTRGFVIRYQFRVTDAELRTLLNHSSEAIIGQNLDGEITAWNRGAETLFGYSAKEAMGKTLASLIVPRPLQNEEARSLARAGGGVSTYIPRTERCRKDGSEIWVEVKAAPIRVDEGYMIGLLQCIHPAVPTEEVPAE